MKFSDSTSCYYDSVILQFIGDIKGGQWKVQRYRHSASYYRTKPEAYQAAIQLLFDAQAEEGEFEKAIQVESESLEVLEKAG